MAPPRVLQKQEEQNPQQQVQIAITLPMEIYKKYGKSLKEATSAIENRLKTCVDVLSDKPFVFTDEEFAEIQSLLKKNFFTPRELIDTVRAITTATLDGIELPVPPDVLVRLESRARMYKQSVGEYVRTVFVPFIKEHVGL